MGWLCALRWVSTATGSLALALVVSCGDASGASKPSEAGSPPDASTDAAASTPRTAQADRRASASPSPSPGPSPAGATGANPTPAASLAAWQKETLDAHNAARAQEAAGLPALAWHAGLAAFAQEWADALKAKGCTPAHRPSNARTFEGKLVGENIYWQSRSGFGTPGSFGADGAKISNAWASEKPGWNFTTKSCASGAVCGHYTQMVWKTTTKLGCGRAACGTAEVWVCNYQAAGNFVGENPY